MNYLSYIKNLIQQYNRNKGKYFDFDHIIYNRLQRPFEWLFPLTNKELVNTILKASKGKTDAEVVNTDVRVR